MEQWQRTCALHKEQAELRKQYLAAGMTEEQIQALHAFDREWYKSRRREAVHTQRLDIQTSEDEDINKDNPLYKKFFEKLAVEGQPCRLFKIRLDR